MSADERPNIVFILADNVGWGDWSCYGGTTPTPEIDKLAAEGIRFNNYTVESECTPTRTAILTGRQSVRCGTYTVVPGKGKEGLSPWEYTLAELLSDAGYATSLWGKWHLGQDEGRLPTDQGFDEWWGYKNSADECGWTSYAQMRELAKQGKLYTPQLWEGKKGEKSTPVRELNEEVRPFLEELMVGKATDYIKQHANGDKPFFCYVGLSQVHFPEAVHPDFDQTEPSRTGPYSDIMAEQSYRVGQIVDCVEECGISDNTVIVFSSDNAALDMATPNMWGGSNGPYRGSFFDSPWEGCFRTGAMVRWPGHIQSGLVTEQMLSAHDWYKTLAALAGASDRVPTDRPMDGVDASQFFLGKSEETGRETIVYIGSDGEIAAAKWHNLKVVLRTQKDIQSPIVKPTFPMIFDIENDTQERYNLSNYRFDNMWMAYVVLPVIAEFEESVAKYPNIPPGTEDFQGYGKAADGDGAGAKAQPVPQHA
jgi:arylsulfatase A-like enzyme